ncbi:caspase family protein [uncultured Cohaesibacter sp.]|uniref:caspase family protein n=1 Tax=uncultured Cohaesibacter sp. TaxID=1002546 RepID=UPI0029C8FAF6|nr:caspase family protein [uncultured Cohaesibacter sp.]
MAPCMVGKWVAIAVVAVMTVAVPATAQEASRGLTLTVKENGVDATIPLYQRSFALVIGNDHYLEPTWVSLSNAIKDAEEVAKALEERGFEVTLAKNLDSRELERTVEEFVIYKGRYPDARLFIWYAGHGHTIDGEGYLVPTDAPDPELEDGVDFRFKALSLRRFGEFMREARAPSCDRDLRQLLFWHRFHLRKIKAARRRDPCRDQQGAPVRLLG